MASNQMVELVHARRWEKNEKNQFLLMKSSMNLSDDEFFVKYKKILPLAKLQVGNIWLGV